MVDIINPYIVGTFVPPTIITVNRVFDFDADLGITTDADGVTNWADQDSNVGDLFAESADRSPTLITNGNPAGDGDAVDFNGIGERMKVTGGFTFVQPETIYLVMKWNTWLSLDNCIDGNVDISMLFSQIGTTPEVKIFSGLFDASNTDLSLGTWGIYALVFSGASSSIRVNDNAKTTGSIGTASASGLTLGSRQVNTNNGDFTIARLLGYDTSAHSDAEQDQNITALNAIYNVF